MAAKSTKTRSYGRFTLGGEQAEADRLLRDGFYESAAYMSLRDRDDDRCFLVGRTGTGKTAALQHLQDEHPEHVIRINPEDLSLPYITDLNVMRHLTDIGVHLDPLFIALWKHVLLIEVIKNRYKVDSPAAKENFIRNLRTKISRNKSKLAALEYLEEFEGKFWCETDERVRDITTHFESQIQAEAGGKLGISSALASASAGASDRSGTETRVQQTERYQRVVNETQLPRLNQMMNVLNEDILDSPQHFTYIIIDDLDRDWVDEQVANALIRCLFRAVVDLKRVRNLKVIVALRTNIFEALDFGSKTGGQEEKFRSLTLHLRWSYADLELMLSERARASAARLNMGEISSIKDLLPATNKTRGSGLRYILRRTLMRPRDAISFFNECLLLSSRTRLSWETIHTAEREYSVKRLLALRDEWKVNCPDLQRVLQQFSSAPISMTKHEYTRRLDDVALLIAEPDFDGQDWLRPLTIGMWSPEPDGSWIDSYHPMTKMLYEIGFIGMRPGVGTTAVFAEADPSFSDLKRHVAEADAYLVHPAFRPALDIRHD